VGVVLFGAAAEVFAQRLQAIGYSPFIRVQTLEEAVPAAHQLAQATGAQTVLLSPACASFDQYPNFEARGEHFRQLFHALQASAFPSGTGLASEYDKRGWNDDQWP